MDFRRPNPFSASGSSFYDFLKSNHPDVLPGGSLEAFTRSEEISGKGISYILSHGTTILGMKFRGGALIAGDRRATEGYQISDRRIEKVYGMDSHTAIAISGAAGPCIDMARLFRTELEHYEKVEGCSLSTEGKANKLAQMIKGNLPLAAQGLVVIPIFVGFDEKREEGRIFKYDIAGGRFEETDFYSTGSGGKDARSTLKKVFRSDMNKNQAISGALEALYEAAEEDVGTGGPDLIRGIFPTVKTITAEGIEDIPEDLIRGMVETLIETRKQGG